MNSTGGSASGERTFGRLGLGLAKQDSILEETLQFGNLWKLKFENTMGFSFHPFIPLLAGIKLATADNVLNGNASSVDLWEFVEGDSELQRNFQSIGRSNLNGVNQGGNSFTERNGVKTDGRCLSDSCQNCR